MDIFETRDKRHGIRILESGGDSLGKLFASYFPWKIEISFTHSRNFKYDAGQEIRTMPIRHGDMSQQEILKFYTCKQQADWIHNGRERIFNR